MNGGDAKLPERRNNVRIGTSDFSNDGRLHQASLESEITRPKSMPPIAVNERIDLPGVAFKNLVTVFGAQGATCVDVSLRIIEILTSLWVDAADGAHHLGTEQDIVRWDDLEKQLDARQMVDAGVEEDVVADQLRRAAAASCPARGRGSGPSGTARLRRRAG